MPCLNAQLRKFQILHILYMEQTFIAIKKQISLIKISDIFMYEKNPQYNISSLAAILDAILYEGSLINCSQITRSHFEPFYTWNNLNLIQ